MSNTPEIEAAWGEDGAPSLLYCRGHIDAGTFAERANYEFGEWGTVDSRRVMHAYLRWVPNRDPDFPWQMICHLQFTAARGAAPVTCCEMG